MPYAIRTQDGSRKMRVVCHTCMHHCSLEPGQRGLCRARKNEQGTIICENYGKVTSLALDAIEKKPLKLFYPGSRILSVGSYGCNLRCAFCQNHEISMADAEAAKTVYLSPKALVDRALACTNARNIGVAFTYNEPLVGWEYIRDTGILVKKAGLKNVLVTNGTASLEILDEILPLIDAMNIDLKGFQESYYKELGGDLETVKNFILHATAGCHVELTTLIVPGKNDTISEMEEEASWIASVGAHVGKDIPLHVTRFFPRYHLTDRDATAVDKVYSLAQTAKKYLKYVFVGNC